LNWKTIFKSFKNSDMRNRVLAVLGIIIVYRFMAHIPVPLAEPTVLKDVINSMLGGNDSLGGFINLLSGGALSRLSIMLVGLAPYITASIISQLLTKAVPKLEEMHKDGESGRRKINQWTRIVTLPLALLQSVAFIFILRGTYPALAGIEMSMNQWVIAVSAMTAGAMMLMWLGEIITEKGIGNGISLLIFASIISQLPKTLSDLGSSIFTVSDPSQAFHVFNWFTIPWLNHGATILLLIMGMIAVVVLYILVKINEGQRIITINYAKRVHGNSAYGGIKSILPIKLITAGVIPVIFAVAFLSLPAFLGQLLVATGNNAELGQNLILWFQRSGASSFSAVGDWTQWIYPIAYFLLVVGFTYFYTSIVFNSSEIAENLQKQGGFIDGVRPGKQTEKYLTKIVNRLTLFGSLALGLIAVLPFVFEYIFTVLGMGGAAQNLAIGGTGLLIVVSVALESLRQLNSRALMVTYDEYK